jgi:hypothetical protein
MVAVAVILLVLVLEVFALFIEPILRHAPARLAMRIFIS